MLSTLSSLPHLLDSPYLPSWHDIRGVAGFAVSLLLFFVLGSVVTPRRTLPEIQLATGWGLVCVLLTVWGVLTPWSLQLPAAALGLAAIAWLARPGWRVRTGLWVMRSAALGTASVRVLLLTLPLWLVMLSVRPSQIDTWLNLLPNAAYLFDHAVLPTALRPPSYSFLPVAPYNSQFAGYIASLASGNFADSAMSFLNIALLCAAGLLFARVVAAKNTARMPPARTQAEVAKHRERATTAPDHEPTTVATDHDRAVVATNQLRAMAATNQLAATVATDHKRTTVATHQLPTTVATGRPNAAVTSDRGRAAAVTDRTPPWWACAVGLLLGVPLNPGFVPRDFFAPYGEASLAVTTLFAVWLATGLLGDLARGIAWPRSIVPLALVLVALVNIKQSGIGLLLPLGVSMLVLAWADPRIPRRQGLIACLAALLPALALYLLVARRFAIGSFPAGELEPLRASRMEHRAGAADHPRHARGDVPEGHILPLRGGGTGAGGRPDAARSVEPRRPRVEHDRRHHLVVHRLPAIHLRRAFPAVLGGSRALLLPLRIANLPAGDPRAEVEACCGRWPPSASRFTAGGCGTPASRRSC